MIFCWFRLPFWLHFGWFFDHFYVILSMVVFASVFEWIFMGFGALWNLKIMVFPGENKVFEKIKVWRKVWFGDRFVEHFGIVLGNFWHHFSRFLLCRFFASISGWIFDQFFVIFAILFLTYFSNICNPIFDLFFCYLRSYCWHIFLIFAILFLTYFSDICNPIFELFFWYLQS